MRTRKNNNPGPECGLSFEQAIQRLEQIAVSLDEEEQITVVDVAGRARAARHARRPAAPARARARGHPAA
jgi:hypothetical protein